MFMSSLSYQVKFYIKACFLVKQVVSGWVKVSYACLLEAVRKEMWQRISLVLSIIFLISRS